MLCAASGENKLDEKEQRLGSLCPLVVRAPMERRTLHDTVSTAAVRDSGEEPRAWIQAQSTTDRSLSCHLSRPV